MLNTKKTLVMGVTKTVTSQQEQWFLPQDFKSSQMKNSMSHKNANSMSTKKQRRPIHFNCVSFSKLSVAGAMKEFARASSNTNVHSSSTFNNYKKMSDQDITSFDFLQEIKGIGNVTLNRKSGV